MIFFVHGIAAWLELMALAFCIGVPSCGLLVLPPRGVSEIPEHYYSSDRMWRLFGLALAVVFAGSAVELLLMASGMSGRPVSEVFPVLSTVLFRTHYGRVWIIRIVALFTLSFLFWAGLRYRDSRAFLVSALTLAVLIAATRSVSGHAADAGDFSMAEIMDWLHIVAASFWGGGLFVLSFVILPGIVGQEELPAPLLGSVAGRFSRMAGAAVGVLALTALYNAWLQVGSLRGLWLTPYGITLTAKIFLFFLLISLGAFNRYVSVPMLEELGGIYPGRKGLIGGLAVRVMPAQAVTDARGAASRFIKSVRIEAAIVAVVLLFAAVLVQQVPARHALHSASVPAIATPWKK